MATLLKQLNKVGSFFIKMLDNLREVAERHQYPETYGEKYTSLEQTYRLNYTPNNSNTVCLIYTRLFETFPEIQETELFKTLLGEMQYANPLMCTSWSTESTLPNVPKELDAPFENTIITGADRLSYTVWVLWFDDRVEIVKPYPNRGIYRSNCETFESSEKADDMPEGVIKAAKITIGVVASGNMLKGYQWLLYQRNK